MTILALSYNSQLNHCVGPEILSNIHKNATLKESLSAAI